MKLYPGPDRRADEIAIIRTFSPSYGVVSVSSIDGEAPGFSLYAQVLPGERLLTARYVSHDGIYASVADIPLAVMAEAGHTYVVSALPDFASKRVGLRVEDKGLSYPADCLEPARTAGGLKGSNC